ncbi:hypothetical protein BJY01DRAFT_145912 [Aspergillus pseudoustus]|uniref:Uncharacterized protein n=1 Tax=Aspergillus pseudoustus TaxID=1810923 RepID=A0ABR4KD24_9EURO
MYVSVHDLIAKVVGITNDDAEHPKYMKSSQEAESCINRDKTELKRKSEKRRNPKLRSMLNEIHDSEGLELAKIGAPSLIWVVRTATRIAPFMGANMATTISQGWIDLDLTATAVPPPIHVHICNLSNDANPLRRVDRAGSSAGGIFGHDGIKMLCWAR